MLTKDEAVGFPVDMLHMLGSLETLASKVKTLEMSNTVPQSGRCYSSVGLRKQGTEERSNEYEYMILNDTSSVDTIPSMFSELEKGKWRAIEPDVPDNINREFVASSVSSTLHPFLATFDTILLNSKRALAGFTLGYWMLR
jgi:hypothetical protein